MTLSFLETGVGVFIATVILAIIVDVRRSLLKGTPVLSLYGKLCLFVVERWPKAPYNLISRLAQVIPIAIFAAAFSDFDDLWDWYALLACVAIIWFTSSLESYQVEHTHADKVNELTLMNKGLVSKLAESQEQLEIAQKKLKTYIENRAAVVANFPSTQRASVYLLVEEGNGDPPYYILVARFSRQHDFRQSRSFHKENSSRFGVCGKGHSNPNGYSWVLPNDSDDCDFFYEQVWKEFRVMRGLAQRISMKCMTICVRTYERNHQSTGLLVVESQDRELAVVENSADKLIEDRELTNLVHFYRDMSFDKNRPLTSKEIRKWEKDTLTVQSH